MLVLSRKKGEAIVIQNQIEITVLQVEGDTVKIGISAPSDIDIFRKEIYVSIKEANRESAVSASADVNALLKQIKGIK